MTSVGKTQSPQTAEKTSGADIVIQCLVNHGVDTVFAYPGGCQHPAASGPDPIPRQDPRHPPPARAGLRVRRPGLRPIDRQDRRLHGHERPGATNLVTTIADAKLDSVPIIAITGQVGTSVIGTDAFQETPIVEVCRSVTKHHYLVTDVNDIDAGDPRGVLRGQHRPQGPGADRLAQGRPVGPDRARLRRADGPAGLPRRRPPGAARADRRGGGGDPAVEASGDLCRRRRRLAATPARS